MAIKKLKGISVPIKTVKAQLNLWKDDETEARDIAFLTALCQAYQDQVLEYYKSGATPDDRLARVEDICKVFRGIAFTSGANTFTIAAGVFTVTEGDALELARGAGCPVGTTCINGVCAPDPPQDSGGDSPGTPGNN